MSSLAILPPRNGAATAKRRRRPATHAPCKQVPRSPRLNRPMGKRGQRQSVVTSHALDAMDVWQEENDG